MTQEPADTTVDAQVDGAAVVEWGEQEPRSRRAFLAGIFTAVRRDWRLVPVIAGLGAVAIFASLVGEWQVTTVTEPGVFEAQATTPVPAGINQLGSWGTGYLVGIFVLVGCIGLVLFGRPAHRGQVRVLGLSAAGVLVGVLLAATVDLGDESVFLGPSIFGGAPEYEVAYGRGLSMAFLGVGAFAVALYLAGHLMPAPPVSSVPPTVDERAPDPLAAAQGDWPWRRPREARRADDPETDLPPPIDLTVAPAAPFVALPEPKTDG